MNPVPPLSLWHSPAASPQVTLFLQVSFPLETRCFCLWVCEAILPNYQPQLSQFIQNNLFDR